MKDKLNYSGKKKAYYKTKVLILGCAFALGGISALALPVAFSYFNEVNNAKEISAKNKVNQEKVSEEEEEIEVSSIVDSL